MKLLLHPRHDCHGKQAHHHKGNKSHKIMKKMAKLEKKLSKYNFDSSSSEEPCLSDVDDYRSRSLSRSQKRRKPRSHHRRHGRRVASGARSSSSSSSSSDSADNSGSGSSSSSSSSRSPSPCDRRLHRLRHQHRHHHGPHGHLSPVSRSKSFAGRADRSPSPLSRGPHHHRRHHRGRFWHHQCRRLQDGLRGCFTMLSPENEPNARGKSPEAPAGPDQPGCMDLVSPSRSVSRERELANAQVDADIRLIERDAAEQSSVEGLQIDESLAENWTKIARQGLPSEPKNALMNKYSISKNCSSLKAPKINEEIVPFATETGVKRDSIQMQQQNQLGTGLTALGKAITDLNNKTELKKDQQVIDILEEMNEAAVIIVDAHHNMTKIRQALMQSELSKRVRPVVDNCEHDEYLYGKELNKKIENVKGFGKYRKGNRKHERGRNGKGEKRKQPDQDGGQRCKHFFTSHGGPKIH